MFTAKNHTLPDTYRAVQLTEYSDDKFLDKLEVKDLPLPKPSGKQLLIKMHAAPVNPSDLMYLRGMYGVKKPLPSTPGFEGSGTVVATGNNPLAWAMLGRRVSCGAPDNAGGTWAEYLLTDLTRCLPLLPDVTLDQGAALLVNPLTAHAMFGLAKKGGHKAAIQTAAASQLGRMLLRLGKEANLPIIHLVRRQAQVDLLRDLGGEHIIDTSKDGWRDELKDRAKSLKATLAWDAVAGKLTGELVELMPRQSRIVVYGALSERHCLAHPGSLIFKEVTVEGFWLSGWFRETNLLGIIQASRGVQQRLGDVYKTEVRQRYGLEEVRNGVQDAWEKMTEGKTLFVMG